MQPAVLRALEFDRIRLALAREASTSLGRERALALEPATDPDEVRRRLDLTLEAVALTRGSGRLSIDGPEELRAILDRLAVEHEPLPPVGLLGLARFVGSVTALVDRVRRAAPPLLCDLLDPVLPFDDEVAAVRRAIQPSGDVADDASPALREIRDGLRRHRAVGTVTM
jgi:DNA mismatch repair protein MutS2